jgi:aspartate/methionine/tyrosine aminotransferase
MSFPPLLARLLIRSGAARLLPGLQRRLDGGADFLRFCSDRLLASPVGLLERLAACLTPEAPDVLDLAAASPRFDLTPSFTTRLPADRRGWPDPAGLPELRGAVAAKLLADNRLAVSPAEEVLITQGALGAVQTVFDAFVNRRDAVVLLDPASPLYPLLARARGARVRWVGTRAEDGRLRLRFDHLARNLRGARLLVVGCPANPTGGIIAPEDLEQVAWWAARHDALILSDEIFERFAYDAEPTSIAALPLARPRTLTVGSVSKSHALAAARVGWVAAHRHLLRACRVTAGLRSPFVPTLSQLQATQALRTAASAFEPIRARMESRRRHVHERLRAMGLDPVWPAGGLFVWVAVPVAWRSGRAFADDLLSRQRVAVLPGDLFGPSGRRHVRVSYVADDGRLDEGLSRIAALVGGGRKRQAA